MPRANSIPPCPEAPRPASGNRHSYDIELITPMVGGGALAGTVDLDFAIRPTAIRGHLRHWWRLSRGFALGAGMWQREEELFGSTEFPSPSVVTVTVEPTSKGVLQFDPTDSQTVPRISPAAYALFASIENKHLVTQEGLRFRLTLELAGQEELSLRRKAQNERRAGAGRPALASAIGPIESEIAAAVAAWLSYGGVGGRTRRGCGAIHCMGVDTFAWLPSTRAFIGSARNGPIDAWTTAVAVYREFRQTPRGAVHPKTLRSGKTVNVPGRSHWPEADSIRKITGCALKPAKGTPPTDAPPDQDPHDHSVSVAPPALLPAFPRAALGLPINFHFADGPNKGGAAENLDPKDVQLLPLLPGADGRMEKAERMASPVITRPLCIDGQWRPAVIILDRELPSRMQVRVEGKGALVTGDLRRDLPLDCVIGQPLGKLRPLLGKPGAVEALVDFLGSRQFKEIKR